VLAGLFAAFWFIANEVIEGGTLDFDDAVLSAFREPANPADPLGPAWLEEGARDLTSLGSFAVLTIIVVATVLHFLLRGRTGYAAYLLFCVLAGTVLSNGLKLFFNRDRPEWADTTRVFTASFPSGHATLSAVVYLTLGVLLAEATTHRSLRVFYIAFVVLLVGGIGISRLYLGVHYPTDVLAGWSLGTAWALLCWVGATYARAYYFRR
jgi:undecaprenyl-diphosphatase